MATPSAGTAPQSAQQGGGQVQSYESYRDFLSGQGEFPSLSSGVSEGSGPGSGQQDYQPGLATDGQQRQSSPDFGEAFQSGSFFDRGAGSVGQGLINPLEQQQRGYGQDLQKLGESFRQQAGADRSFGGLGGSSIIDRATTPGIGTDVAKDARTQAKDLVGARYTGPQGLDPNGLARVQSNAAQTSQQANALQTGSGVQASLSLGVPNLTPGEVAFETQKLLGDTGFRENARDSAFRATEVPAAINFSEQAAQARAGVRTQQETAIAGQARSYLSGKRSGVETEIQGTVDAKKAENDAINAAYQSIISGDSSAIPQDIQQQIAGTPGNVAERDAEKIWQSVVSNPKYEAIANFQPLERHSTPHGFWYSVRDPVTGFPVDIREVQGIDKATEKLLVERQRELEQYFGPKSDSQWRNFQPLYDYQDRRSGKAESNNVLSQLGIDGQIQRNARARFGHEALLTDDLQDPQYISEADRLRNQGVSGYEPPNDVAPYIQYDQGVSPTKENVSTADQRYMINSINEILDEADRLESTDPAKAASIKIDIQKYLNDEALALETYGGELDQNQRDWKRLVSDAKNRAPARKLA